MIEKDTIKLLRECDSGIRMGVSAINDVYDTVQDSSFRKILADSRAEHETLKSEICSRLDSFGDKGKRPGALLRGMSRAKTEICLGIDSSDNTIADLLTDGCNMGVKSLNRYLNQYKAAEEYSKDIAKKLINLEDKLAEDMRGWL